MSADSDWFKLPSLRPISARLQQPLQRVMPPMKLLTSSFFVDIIASELYAASQDGIMASLHIYRGFPGRMILVKIGLLPSLLLTGCSAKKCDE